MVAYGKLKKDIADILSALCKRKGVKIVEAEVCPDHIHMLVEIPPSLSVSNFMGYLKGKSTLMIFDRLSNVRLFKDSLVKIIGDVFDCYDLIINLFGGQCQII